MNSNEIREFRLVRLGKHYKHTVHGMNNTLFGAKIWLSKHSKEDETLEIYEDGKLIATKERYLRYWSDTRESLNNRQRVKYRLLNSSTERVKRYPKSGIPNYTDHSIKTYELSINSSTYTFTGSLYQAKIYISKLANELEPLLTPSIISLSLSDEPYNPLLEINLGNRSIAKKRLEDRYWIVTGKQRL